MEKFEKKNRQKNFTKKNFRKFFVNFFLAIVVPPAGFGGGIHVTRKYAILDL
jgi:hypothetical protein